LPINDLHTSWRLIFRNNSARGHLPFRLFECNLGSIVSRVFRLSGWLAAACGLLISNQVTAAPAPLTVEEIIRKAVARAESMAEANAQPSYRYTKRTVTDELDTAGNLREHTEKLFDVVSDGQQMKIKLVQFNGRAPSAADLKKEEQQQETERKKIAESKAGGKSKAHGNFFTAELISRYEFKLEGQREINGRAAYYLSFKPKANLPINKIADRFLNQVAGKVWIDVEEFEIARAQVGLQTEVTLWAGIIGTLRRCDFTLERIRLPDGAWFASSTHGIIEGRKVLQNMFVRTRSDSSNFRRDGLVMR
jgi:hypothetical protein